MRLPNTPFVVDNFCLPSSGVPGFQPIFILSHAHTDHLAGLHRDWNAGRIVCSVVTKALIVQQFGLEPAFVVRCPPCFFAKLNTYECIVSESADDT